MKSSNKIVSKKEFNKLLSGNKSQKGGNRDLDNIFDDIVPPQNLNGSDDFGLNKMLKELEHPSEINLNGSQANKTDNFDISNILDNSKVNLFKPNDGANNVNNNNVDETSSVQPDVEKAVKCMASIPEQDRPRFCAITYYHVVPDGSYGKFMNNNNYAGITYEDFTKTCNGRFCVLYDKEDANDIASKMIDAAVQNGSLGVDSQYPLYGVVVVGFKFKDDVNVTFSKGDDINNMGPNNSDVVYYSVKTDRADSRRAGILNKHLNSIEILEEEYIVRKEMTLDNGFALLNLLAMSSPASSLSSVNIKNLRNLLRKVDKNLMATPQNNVEVQSGGNIIVDDDETYYRRYVREKAQYILNKKTLIGGGKKETEEEKYERLYKQRKADYKKLKKQLNNQ